MSGRGWATTIVFLGLSLLAARPVAGGQTWRVVLPDTARIPGGTALLRDICSEPVPAAAGELVMCAGATPNTVVAISRQKILRKLVTAGLSSGVVFQGADRCQMVFAGRELGSEAVAGQIRQALQALVPAAVSGAPDSWFEVTTPQVRLSAASDWQVVLDRRTPLAPGRNLVRVQVVAASHRESFTASVVLHCFDEIGHAVRNIGKDTPLSADQFHWQWQDLAALPHGASAGRAVLEGASTTRALTAGDLLRQADLQETPLILAGDAVELKVVRGQVAVTVRAFARQQGCLGQTIPVRNDLTGRLVNARVAGPGLVEWRR